MLHFNSSLRSVWGQRTLAGGAPMSEFNEHQMAVRPWLSMPGQTTGGIGFYRTASGQPLVLSPSGAYLFDTYKTAYIYTFGKYSFALQVTLSLNETLNLGDSGATRGLYGVTLTEALGLSGADSALSNLPVALADAVGFADVYVFNARYKTSLLETLDLADRSATNAELKAYVMNLNTGAMSTYRNYNFNSFAKIGGKYFGATDDGIYELTGGSDNGVNIDASLKLGTEDFGSDLVRPETMKRVPVAYMGVKTDGTVILKVTANEATNTYTLSPTTRTTLNTGRLKLGNGVASRYWDFEVTNYNGSDLELESLTFFPVELSRRIVEN